MILTPAISGSGALVQIDDVLLGVPDAAGVKWKFTNVTGWWESAPLRDRMTDRPSGDGAYDAQPFRSGRTIVVTGMVAASSRGLAAQAVDSIAGVISDGSLGTFTYLDPDLGNRSCSVRLTGTPQVDASNIGVGIVRWQLAFKSPDWRKYGQIQSTPTGIRSGGTGLTFPLTFPLNFGTPAFGGRVSFTNTGNAPTEPSIRISGPLAAGFELTHVETGRRLRYEATVGTDIILDCAAGTCTSGGQERAMNLTVREWFSVPAQSSATFSFTPLGSETAASTPTAGMTVTIAPAYS